MVNDLGMVFLEPPGGTYKVAQLPDGRELTRLGDHVSQAGQEHLAKYLVSQGGSDAAT
jgi:hypothetical protein